MVDVVREALNKIRALTKPARTVSAWYERHPTELYLPASLDVLAWDANPQYRRARAGRLCHTDDGRGVLELGLPAEDQTADYRGEAASAADYAFADVEAAVLKMLPRGFPYRERGNRAQVLGRPSLSSAGPAKLDYRDLSVGPLS